MSPQLQHLSKFMSITMNQLAFLTPLRVTFGSNCWFRHEETRRRVTTSCASNSSRSQGNQKASLRPKIAVVGGGHAGISTALRLASLPWTRLTRPQITLIDKSDRFVFLPMLYELALSQAAQWEVAPRFSELLDGTGVQFLQGTAENVDTANCFIEGTKQAGADEGAEFRVPFDRAVLALGSEAMNLEMVPGAADHALPFYTMRDALMLKERLASLRRTKAEGQPINIVVVGGGYAGVELTSTVAEDLGTRGNVMLVETSDQILKNGTDFNRRISLDALSENGVTIVYNSRVTEVGEKDVTVSKKLNDGSTDDTKYPTDLVLWTAGLRAASAQQSFGIPLNDDGRIETDKFLQVRGLEDNIFALGDAATTPAGGEYAGTAQVAVQEAEYAAWNTWASIAAKSKMPYKYTHLGEMMVLGATNACVTTSVGLELNGQPAWIARRLAYLARMPTDKHRSHVATSWAAHPVLEALGNLVEASQQYQVNI